MEMATPLLKIAIVGSQGVARSMDVPIAVELVPFICCIIFHVLAKLLIRLLAAGCCSWLMAAAGCWLLAAD